MWARSVHGLGGSLFTTLFACCLLTIHGGSAKNVEGIGGSTPLKGCPPIDLVELPRLKLSFTVRRDGECIHSLRLVHNWLMLA